MGKAELWDIFYKTGRVQDYLNYRAEVNFEGKQSIEIHDRRTDNKGNKCR